MTKRKIRTSETIQLGFSFDPPAPARAEADLAGLDRVVSGCVSIMLKGDDRSRHEIAGAMSALLDERVSKDMLDAYASEARAEHNISAARLLALIAVTERFDLLDSLVRRIGGALLVGDEILAARLGSLKAQRARLDEEIKALRPRVQPIAREAM
ncbi:hypothetical protein JT366_09415 [Sphingomonas paucimobilis]|uniref:hypothetical protein n=1 Tax=Sphingomonas paucimobilis TaxID=13689 RepID=UPI001964794D|nr:hypothetical protein [Sphingomonas paucimobilis]QRY97411.1 hypothetical protein JT366_09415 [Sphingomonas paucimobilis]